MTAACGFCLSLFCFCSATTTAAIITMEAAAAAADPQFAEPIAAGCEIRGEPIPGKADRSIYPNGVSDVICYRKSSICCTRWPDRPINAAGKPGNRIIGSRIFSGCRKNHRLSLWGRGRAEATRRKIKTSICKNKYG